MPFELWLAFVAATVILLVIPGPTILTVVSYSVLHGGRATVPLVTGVALGDSAALALSLAGLGALLSVSAFWFNALKWVGGLYLLYLGITMFGRVYRFHPLRRRTCPLPAGKDSSIPSWSLRSIPRASCSLWPSCPSSSIPA